MATTSGNLTAGKILATGRGSDDKGSKGRKAGLVATAALGIGLLVGVVAQGQQAARPVAPASNGAVVDAHIATVWDFREDRRIDALAAFAPDFWTYREDLRPVAASAFVPDQFTYREDRRVGTVAQFQSDQFTYREDRRADGTTPSWSPDFWTYREDRRER